MDTRKLSAMMAVLMLLLAGNLLLGVSAQGTEHVRPNGLFVAKDNPILLAPSGRAFNATEHMGYTTTPPTIDGNLNANEWTDASTYDISTTGTPVILHIMFDDNKIYVAIDAFADKTNDQGDPPDGYVSDASTDFFTISFDGDNDQKVTWKDQWDTTLNREAPGECPPSLIQCYWGGGFTYQGLDLDRGASTSGGAFRIAGWWCEAYASTGNSLWNVPTGPNQGNSEPYDYINTAFGAHRTYEYSIPYTGGGNELSKNKLDTVGLSIVVNDANSGAPRNIGRIPSGANGVSKPLQVFMLNGKPKAVMNPLTSSIFYTGESIDLSGTGSTDPESETMTYAWDFDYDGFAFQSTATTETTNHVYNTPGTYTIALKASDPHGAEALAKTTIKVVQPEYPPTFSNVTPAQDQVLMDEGTSTTFSASYNDKNLGIIGEHVYGQWTVNDAVVKTFDSTKAGSSNYQFKANFTGDRSTGKYKIQLLVNDSYNAEGKYTGGSITSIQSWNLTVTNVNRAPVILTHIPEVTEVTTNEETKAVFSITKSDPDGDVMTTSWFVDNKPQTGAGDTFTYLNLPDYLAAGPHIVKVLVKDAGDPPQNTTFQWAVTVGNINRAPKLKSFSPTSTSMTLDEGKSIDLKVTAEDQDLDTLEYIWLLNGETIDGADTNSYTFKTDFNSATGQDYTLKVVVTDTYQATATKEWTITVKDIDRPPVIVVSKPNEGDRFPLSETVSFDASKSSDPDLGDSLSYVWNFGDSSSKSTASATHKYSQPGQYSVQLIVTSTHNKVPIEIEQTINITIDASELEVSSVTTDVPKLTEGQKLTISVDVANKGALDIKTMTVKLFMDDTVLVGQLDNQAVTAGQNNTVVFTWTATSPGTHRFKAQLIGDKNSIISDKKVTSFDVVVEKKVAPIIGGGGGGISLYLIVLLLVVIVVIIVVFAVISSRKKKREAEERARVEAERVKAAEDERKRAEAAAYSASMQPFYPPPPPQQMVMAQSPPSPPPPPPPTPTASPFVSRRARRHMDEAEEDELVKPAPPKADITPEMAKVASDAGVCPACGESVEKSWTRCQNCDQRLIVQAAPTVAAPKPAAVPAKPPPPPPPPPPAAMPKAPPPPPKPAVAPAKSPAPPAAPSNMCPKCGDEIEPDWLKCPSCGAALKEAAAPKAAPKPASQALKCPKCGEDVEPEWTKCPFCSSML